MNKEFLNASFEVKGDITSDSEYFYFEGYASVFNNIDLGNDIIKPGAFKESIIGNPNLPILWQHKMDSPIGVIVEMKEDEYGLYIKAKLPKEDKQVSEKVIPQMKVGSIREMSIGYMVEDYEMEKQYRQLNKINLFEVSLVTKAMNPKAKVTGFKAVAAVQDLPIADREKPWDSTNAEKRIRDFTNSVNEPSPDYRKYFMYFDESAPENFGSYKLLFADVVNGKPHIVPRAVYAIAGVLNGARGGVDIPDADRSKIEGIINTLYRRLADKFDDSSIESPLEAMGLDSVESIKDIEKILKERFSQKQAKTLISKVKEFSDQRDVEEGDEQRDAAQTIDIKSLSVEIQKTLNKFLN